MSLKQFACRFAICCLALAASTPVVAQSDSGTVLITGANRGIGLGLAKRFSEAGYSVIGTARNPVAATELRNLGVRVEKLDVTDPESVETLAQRLNETPVDILINNAGIKGQDNQKLPTLDVEAVNTVFDVNILGPLRVTQALFDNVGASQRKIVANISSMMGSNQLNTWGCCVDYRASKAAINMVTTTLAVDFGEQGMTFVTLHPGYVQTDMNNGQGNITTAQSAEGLFNVISGLSAEDNGHFYDWNGKELPW